MTELTLTLLGPFRATIQGIPVVALRHQKVRALLAYLIVEGSRPHSREDLAAWLWPDVLPARALGNLRSLLCDIRQVFNGLESVEPVLLIDRNEVQFNRKADCWVDAVEVEGHLATGLTVDDYDFLGEARSLHPETVAHLSCAAELYRGRLLEGFFCDSAAFEQWLIVKREYFDRRMLQALQYLAAHHEAAGRYDQSIRYVRQTLGLEPWHEESHVRLMRLLALSGQRSAALAQFETCRRLLATELAVEPARATVDLYHQIRNGQLARAEVAHHCAWPTATQTELSPGCRAAARCFDASGALLARRSELARLQRACAATLAGQGQAMFVTGTSGSGKSRLAEEIAHLALKMHPAALVAWGACDQYAGVGICFQPFFESLHMLLGDNLSTRPEALSDEDHAARRRSALPHLLAALAVEGPDLLGLLHVEKHLDASSHSLPPQPSNLALPNHLEGPVARTEFARETWRTEQSIVIDQVTQVLRAVSRHLPLVLVLDSLQWADTSTISLLFHLSHNLRSHRIFVLGLSRPVAADRTLCNALHPRERHPLETVICELQRDLGDVVIDLDQSDGQALVDRLLDTEPNRLGADCRTALCRATAGNPLLTIELLQANIELGHVVRESDGLWTATTALQLSPLPARIQAVMAEWIEDLPDEWQDILSAASEQGDEFAAEVVAQALGQDPAAVVCCLSGPLAREYRLVVPLAVEHMGNRLLSHYRFRCGLVRAYLQGTLDLAQHTYLTNAVREACAALEVPASSGLLVST